MSQTNSDLVSAHYMIDDVDAAVGFYTNHLGFLWRLMRLQCLLRSYVETCASC